MKTYGCCKCQTFHNENEKIYEDHIMHQSKHGIIDLYDSDKNKNLINTIKNNNISEDYKIFFIIEGGTSTEIDFKVKIKDMIIDYNHKEIIFKQGE